MTEEVDVREDVGVTEEVETAGIFFSGLPERSTRWRCSSLWSHS